MAMGKDKWIDISVELYREYIYPNTTLRINKPALLMVTESSLGGHAHRIESADLKAHYISPGWVAIRWEVADGHPLFKI